MGGGGGDRRPLVVLLCLALLAVALFVTGAVGASGGPDGGGGSSLVPQVSLGRGLTADDLRVTSGSCAVEGTSISFVGGCALQVVPADGGRPWSDVTRRARLDVETGTVTVAATIMGKRIDADLDAGEDVRLVFTRDGGDLSLACLAVGSCQVILSEDTVP